jgi:hypothetical protein
MKGWVVRKQSTRKRDEQEIERGGAPWLRTENY